MNLQARLDNLEKIVFSDDDIKNLVTARAWYRKALGNFPIEEILAVHKKINSQIPVNLLTIKATGKLKEAELKTEMRDREMLLWDKETAEQQARECVAYLREKTEKDYLEVLTFLLTQPEFQKVDFERLKREYL